MKHNKKRNTALLIEFLKHSISEAIVNDDVSRAKKGVFIVKKYFTNPELKKEKRLYDLVISSFLNDSLDDSYKSKMLEESFNEYSKIDQEKLDHIKDKLIKEINYTLGKKTYDVKLDNYKLCALVNSIWRTKNRIDRMEYVGLIKDEIYRIKNGLIVEDRENSLKNNMSLIESYKKAVTQLLPNQKEVLKEYTQYIQGESNDDKLGKYLDEKKEELIIRLAILKENGSVKDETTKKNFDKVIEVLTRKNVCPCSGNIEETVKYVMEIQDFLNECSKLNDRKLKGE